LVAGQHRRRHGICRVNTRMLKQFVCVGVFIGSILLAPLAFAENESADEREGKIKAACLYYLAKFVEWPARVFQNSEMPLRLCILGKDPLNAFVISTMDGKTVGNRKIEIAFRSQGANDQHD